MVRMRTDSDATADRDLRTLEAGENFPVALRVLPAATRRRLRAIYDVARTVDDIGDVPAQDTTEALLAFRADLDRIWAGSTPEHPVLRGLVGTVRELDLPAEPFHRLIEAGLADQRVHDYVTFDDLLGYCRNSADPVGRLVLAVFGVTDPHAAELSDRVCTALQLLEHWQDVGEDRRAGRIYLPAEDRVAHGVTAADLDAAGAGPALRTLVGFETDRAARLLVEGSAVVGRLRGWARVAVAGYVAGGLATVQALRRSGYDPLTRTPRPRRRDVLRAAVTVAARGTAGGAA